jgi:type IV pilus assembly protein PilA
MFNLGVTMFKKVQKGFTLIELMIVIAIIGILAAIAIPAYQNYTIRSQITEGLSLADGWKTAISEYYAQNGSFPASSNTTTAGAAGSILVSGASQGKYVSAISVSGLGDIGITYSGSQANAKISGLVLGLVPLLDGNNDVVWVCGSATVPTGVTSAVITAATTVPAAYLPNSCHA